MVNLDLLTSCLCKMFDLKGQIMLLVQITQHNLFLLNFETFFLEFFIVKQFCNLQTDISMPAKRKQKKVFCRASIFHSWHRLVNPNLCITHDQKSMGNFKLRHIRFSDQKQTKWTRMEEKELSRECRWHYQDCWQNM